LKASPEDNQMEDRISGLEDKVNVVEKWDKEMKEEIQIEYARTLGLH
jgi:hypothetical protein